MVGAVTPSMVEITDIETDVDDSVVIDKPDEELRKEHERRLRCRDDGYRDTGRELVCAVQVRYSQNFNSVLIKLCTTFGFDSSRS